MLKTGRLKASGALAAMVCCALTAAEAQDPFLDNARSALETAQSSGDPTLTREVLEAYVARRPDLADALYDVYLEAGGAFFEEEDLEIPEVTPPAATRQPLVPKRVGGTTVLVPRAQTQPGTAATPPAAPTAPEEGQAPFWRKGWSGSAALGIEVEAGNTEETEVDIDTDVSRKFGKWETDYRLDYARTETFGVKNEDDLLGRFDARRDIGGRWALGGFVNAERDVFSGFDYRLALGGIVSYRFIDREKLTWRASVGPGLRFDRLQGEDGTISPILAAESRFRWQFAERWSLGNDFTSSFGDGQVISSVTFVEASLFRSWAVRAAQKIDVNTDAPSQAVPTDTTNTLSVVYRFGEQAQQ